MQVLIHTFVTKSYLPWAELYLEALRYQFGRSVHIRIDGWDLEDKDIRFLYDIHPNVSVYNHGFGYSELMQNLELDEETVRQWQEQIAAGRVDNSNFHYKLFITVDKRFRSIPDIAENARAAGYDLLVHTDVDLYVRGSLERTLQITQNYDVGMYFRLNKDDRMKALAAFMVFNLNGSLNDFFANWKRQIDAVHPKNRWRDFGQSSLWYAIEESTNTRFADFTTIEKAARHSKTFEQDADIWLNSNSVIRGNVMGAARKRCWDDLKNGFPRISPDYGGTVLRDEFWTCVWRGKELGRRRLKRIRRYMQSGRDQ